MFLINNGYNHGAHQDLQSKTKCTTKKIFVNYRPQYYKKKLNKFSDPKVNSCALPATLLIPQHYLSPTKTSDSIQDKKTKIFGCAIIINNTIICAGQY